MKINATLTAEDFNIGSIKLSNCIIPMYNDVLKDVLMHKHTHYVGAGGRGSTKSSFFGGICIPLLIIANPNVHAVCFRKVGNTIQTSIHSQITWGIYQLGLEHLFKIPKTYSTPIVYLPTGQQIFFMGMDDPNKVKSIKTSFGYIGITWWEELDQFAGEAELRKVLQSTMRGGDKFWDFRTFNPPISKLNWANEYAERAETLDNTLVIRNTYLDVPISWLGNQFIEEAEELRNHDARAYVHEYLGIAIGTGGDIFPNACNLDMDELVSVGDRQVPMWETFDNIYCGIDWGYAKDPFRFTRCHFDVKHRDLYIFREFNSYKMRNKDVFDALYDELHLVGYDEQVIADSAEPKSIDDFKAYGAFIRGADKGPQSRRYSMKWLQGLSHIYIDRKHCPQTYWEFVNYEYETDRDGNFLSDYPDGNDHGIDACIDEDTRVYTPSGYIRIGDMNDSGMLYAYDKQTKDIIETPYINCRMTYEDAEIWEVELEDGRIVECTYDHKILTSNRGYVMACELTEDDDIITIY